MTPAIITLVILGVAVVAFMSNRVAIEVVAVGVAIALWATGIVTADEAVHGFGDQTVVFIATLFVVWQVINFFAFRSLPTAPILVGGALILTGGLIVSFWRTGAGA